ncbi:hypothetical protein GY25_02285 [Pedobacter himalayensis]|nr:hypothetical protein GY25_02285 [Pedobacter himalayensis]
MSELVKRGHDQAAELKASCGAVDVRTVAQLISDLATQLDVQLARSNALAAENAGLKNAAEFATADDMWEELGGNVMRYQYQEWYADRLKSAMEIPATSASLAEVRAQGVESGIDMLIAIMNHQHPAASQAIDILRIHAEHLRKGVQS